VSVPSLSLAFVSQEAAQAASVGAGEPDWLLAERLDAARRVAALPAENNQLFTPYLDLRAARFEAITVTGPPRGIVSAGQLPEGAAALVSTDGTREADCVLGAEAVAAGIIIDTLRNVLRDHPAVLGDAVRDGATLPGDDAFAQVPRAVSTLDLVIHVPAGVHLEEPIVVRARAGEPGTGTVGRTIVALGAGASARLLEEQLGEAVEPVPGGTTQRLWWNTLELLLSDGASLEVAGLQDFDQDTIAIVNRHATLGVGARLQWALASVGAQLHRSRIDNLLIGRGSSVHQVEIGFGGGSQLFDLTSYTRHIGEDTTGDLLSKGVFTDRARGYIKGLIEIRRSATGTDSFLGEFGMLLAKRARSVTIPSLEIDQPNVRRAAHSSSVGPIDEAQIFYLESRGVDRETARRLIVLAFLEPVVARIPLPEAQDRLRALLEAKWPRLVEAPRAA
jgi:Fe-S cluster assembly protein SufD